VCRDFSDCPGLTKAAIKAEQLVPDSPLKAARW